MDIENKIRLLEEEISELRVKWKTASIPMKKEIEKEAKNKQSQIHVFQSVLRRRGLLPPKKNQPRLI